MSQVVSGVLERLGDILPNQIGENRRWSTAAVTQHIMFADRLVRERTGTLYHVQEFFVRDDGNEYTLESEFIDIISVEFAQDGSTYDWYLKPLTLDDLDKINIRWRKDSGTRPEFYSVLSTPGVFSATLLIYRTMSAVDGQKIRVTGLSTGTSTTVCPDDILSKCHVPHVMAVLLAKENPRKAAEWFGKYLSGVDEVRRRTLSKYSSGTIPIGVGW
jgi:hypothetical protein